MVTGDQKKTLKKFLALAPDPETAFCYDELTGFLYGLALTPDALLSSEWIPRIFAGKMPEFASANQAREIIDGLLQVHNTFHAAFHAGSLVFPFDIFSARNGEFSAILGWTLGFDMALSLRPDIWEPDTLSALPQTMVRDVISSLMVIEGLLAPEVRTVDFDRLPQEILKEAVTETDAAESDTPDRQLAVLLFTLPMAIEQLQTYARSLEAMKTPGLGVMGKAGSPWKKTKPSATRGKLIHGRFPGSGK